MQQKPQYNVPLFHGWEFATFCCVMLLYFFTLSALTNHTGVEGRSFSAPLIDTSACGHDEAEEIAERIFREEPIPDYSCIRKLTADADLMKSRV